MAIRAGFHPADFQVQHIGDRRQYRCLTCLTTTGAPELHRPGSTTCEEARRERIISRAE